MSSATGRTRVALFGYGSLVSLESAALTLERAVPAPVPALLTGWRRRWSQFRDNTAVEKTFARSDDGTVPSHVLGLNIEPSEGTPPINGALVEVTEDELARLDARELRYDRVEVTEQVQPREGFARVYAYRGKRGNHAPEPPPGAVVIAAYVRQVEAAFAELGPDQARLYRETTEPPRAEVIEAVLVHDRIPPGNPREW